MLGCSESKVAKNKDNAMNENQKERLLKIAETNPELAKEMMDFMKEERQSSQEPIAVKMVKAEEDKLTFTEEQKKWAFAYMAIPIGMFLVFFFTGLLFGSTINKAGYLPLFVSSAMIIGIIGIIFTWVAAYKAGVPTVKQFMSKHFKYINN